MNRNYKVIWNQSLNCFMAVSEYAKSCGKSSSSVVSSTSSLINDKVAGGKQILRLSALCMGLAAAGVSMQTIAAYNAGAGSSATGNNSVAIGDNAKATAGQSIAIGGVAGGQVTTASGDQSIAIGANVVSAGSSSIAIGGDDLDTASKTNMNGTTSAALNGGEVNTIFRKYSDRDLVNTANQYPNTASSGAASVAIGVQAISSGALSTAFGTQTNASGVASAAFGVSASATKEGSVALGAGSKTDGNATKVTRQTINDVEFTGFVGNSAFAGTAADAGRQVSVGIIGNERQIKNVAPGELSATSTDAINGSQIYAVSSKLIDNIKAATNTAPVVYTNTAGVKLYKQANGNFNTAADGSGTNVAANNIIASLQSAAGSTTTVTKLSNVAAGTLSATSTDAVNGSQLNATNTNVTTNASNITKNTSDIATNTANITKAKTTVTAGANVDVTPGTNTDGSANYIVKTKDDLALTSVTTGNSLLNTAGLTIKASDSANNVVLSSTGLNNGNNKIINVKAGTLSATSTDAVNGSQLNATNTNVATNASNITNLTEGKTGIVRQDANTGAITVGAQTAGSSVSFANTSGGTRTLSGVTAGSADTDAVNFSQLKTVSAKADNSVQYDQAGKTSITLGGGAEGTAITNVKAGRLSATSTDAVNGSQLNATNTNVTTNASNITKNTSDIATITAGAVQYDRNTDGTVNYDRITAGNGKGTPVVIVKNAEGNFVVVSGGTAITNVANGINADDAINKGQLDSIIANNITDVDIKDQNGNVIAIKNVTQNVVNTKVSTNYEDNKDSLFLTYNKEGQLVTDRLTIGETVQKMNTEGVKFAHTNASPQSKGDIANGVTNDSSAGGINSTALGVNAIIETGADSTVALGHNTKASKNAKKSIVIGKDSIVQGASSIAIGDSAQALGNKSISIGTGNIVNGNNSGAFGDPSIINGNNSYSVGNNNTINSEDTFVLGNDVKQTTEGSVVLGTGSGATTGAGIVGYLANVNDVNNAIFVTRSTTGAVAVGNANAGIYRQITGVAAGTADSDAVNVSQLKAVNNKIDNSHAAINDSAVQYDKNQDGTVNKGSITLSGGTTGTIITNIANGVNSSDAVNKGQLDKIGNSVAGIIGGDAAYDADGNLTATNIGGTGKDNISDAIKAVNQGNAANSGAIKDNSANIEANTKRLDNGLSFGADSGDNINKSIGDGTALKFEGGKNITTTATGNGIQFDLNGNISVDSVTTGHTTVNNNGVTIKEGPSMTIDGIYAGNKTITGVADGIKVNDAVNLGQLNALDQRISNSVNELGYKVSEVEDGANAGVSAAMAMSSLPQAYIPGKSMIGGGIATYNGQSAVAVGISKVSDNGRWVIKANGTADTQGNAGGAVGAGFHF